MKRKEIPWKKITIIVLSSLLILLSICALILTYIHNMTGSLIYEFDQIKDIDAKKVVIVFGAAVNPNTSQPSDVLADRIKTGVEVYKSGKAEKIIMSGDNRFSHYNEPQVMMEYAASLGVPEEDIVFDYAGRRTYDTCYRAKEIFQVDEAVLVTQEYHLYRAIYTCNALGVDSIGVSASLQPYKYQSYYNIRELAATLYAFFQVNITRPKPILGEEIDIFEPSTLPSDSQAS